MRLLLTEISKIRGPFLSDARADYLQQNLTFAPQIFLAEGQNLQHSVRLSRNLT